MCLTRIFVGGVAGIAATHLMDGIGEVLYRRWMTESDRNMERAVEPKFPLLVLGERIASAAGATSESGEKIGVVLHWAIGFLCGGLYAVSEGRIPLQGIVGGQLIAMGMLAVDEFGFYATGLAPPPRAFPTSTHVRAFLSHVTYGASLSVIYKGMNA